MFLNKIMDCKAVPDMVRYSKMCIRDRMLHQPSPDKAPDLLGGIIAIRRLHIRVMEESGLTAADEMLYPENRSYLDDVLSYEAVGVIVVFLAPSCVHCTYLAFSVSLSLASGIF